MRLKPGSLKSSDHLTSTPSTTQCKFVKLWMLTKGITSQIPKGIQSILLSKLLSWHQMRRQLRVTDLHTLKICNTGATNSQLMSSKSQHCLPTSLQTIIELRIKSLTLTLASLLDRGATSFKAVAQINGRILWSTSSRFRYSTSETRTIISAPQWLRLCSLQCLQLMHWPIQTTEPFLRQLNFWSKTSTLITSN